MNPNRMRNRTTRPMRGWQLAFGACLVAVLLATTSLTTGAAWWWAPVSNAAIRVES
jgi:hypothetical protein